MKVTFLTIHFVTYISKVLLSQKVLTIPTYLLPCVVLPDLCNWYIHNNVMNEVEGNRLYKIIIRYHCNVIR